LLLSVGDHYIEAGAIADFKKSQPDADILVHVEMKKCDDEDMKVFIDTGHQLHTISKMWGKSSYSVLGEFSGLIRFSPQGSRLFFDTLNELGWQRPLGHEMYLADLLMACHRSMPLAFYLSSDHRRMDVDYPSDYARARELYATRPIPEAPTGSEDDTAEEPGEPEGIRFESSWHTA
jgi:choline kinase